MSWNAKTQHLKRRGEGNSARLLICPTAATASASAISSAAWRKTCRRRAGKGKLLFEQTKGADIGNQLSLGDPVARRAAEARANEWLTTHGGNPGGAGLLVAGGAGSGAPPVVPALCRRTATPRRPFRLYPGRHHGGSSVLPRGSFSTSGAGWRAQHWPAGDTGTGHDRAAIAARSTAPLSAGTRIDTSGTGQGPYITGGSEYTHAGDVASGTADIGLANQDLETGNAAKANLGKVNRLLDLFNTVVAPASNVGGKLAGDIKEKLANDFGVSPAQFDDVAAAKELIRKQLLTFVGGLRD